MENGNSGEWMYDSRGLVFILLSMMVMVVTFLLLFNV